MDKQFETLNDLQHRLDQALASLTLWETKFDVIFHHAPDAIMVLEGQTGIIIEVNQTFQRLLGYQPLEVIGQHFSTFMSLPESSENSADDDTYRIHGAAFEGQNFKRADGTTCPMDLTFAFIIWNEDPAILVTLRDVTDRRLAEKAQEQLIEELDAFAHTVAHDLKAPLAILLGASEFLQGLKNVDDKTEMLTTIIRNNSLKMNNIVDELLLLAKMRDDAVDFTPLNMAQIVDEACQRLQQQISAAEANISQPTSWPEAVGYAPWVEEVWVNYLSNALKYSGTPPQIEFGADEPAEQMVKFWLRDNGPGLTLEEQQQVFIKFTQLAQARATGHGLGLSIVQRIIERLGGKVDVESEVGVGTVFSFTLPQKNIE